MKSLDYQLIRLLFVVFSMDVEEIAAQLNENVHVVRLAVFSDMKLKVEDREAYESMPLQERVKVFDLERLQAFQARYVILESTILGKVQSLLASMDDDVLNPSTLSSLAKTLQTLRAPVYKEYDTEDLELRKSAKDCEAQAKLAIERLDQIRAQRLLQ